MNTVIAIGSPGSAVRAVQMNPALGLDAIQCCIEVARMFNLMGETLPLGFDADTANTIRGVVLSAQRDCDLRGHFDL